MNYILCKLQHVYVVYCLYMFIHILDIYVCVCSRHTGIDNVRQCQIV